MDQVRSLRRPHPRPHPRELFLIAKRMQNHQDKMPIKGIRELINSKKPGDNGNGVAENNIKYSRLNQT